MIPIDATKEYAQGRFGVWPEDADADGALRLLAAEKNRVNLVKPAETAKFVEVETEGWLDTKPSVVMWAEIREFPERRR